MANNEMTTENAQLFCLFKFEERERNVENKSRFELWRGTGGRFEDNGQEPELFLQGRKASMRAQ